MSKIPYTAAYLRGEAFNCPACGAYAKQSWSTHWYDGEEIDGLLTSKCAQCDKYAIWNYSTLLYPETSTIEMPNEDLPKDIENDYREAMSIAQKSPRAAAALLRLAIQKLCIELGESGKNLNQDIKNLVKNGLSPKVQKMLDVVRVIGNHSVHPGEINLNDSPEIAQVLFRLVNRIVGEMITNPKDLDNLYESLPEDDKQSIVKRDNNQIEENKKIKV